MKRSRFLFLAVVLAPCALLLGGALSAFAQDGDPAAAPADPIQADTASAVGSPDATRAALGTAFTYQGNLKRNGQPVNTTCSFQFSLWDAAAGGGQKGTTQNVNNAAVQTGVFTVRLDFGNHFTGEARWLQTALQCAGDGGYTTLAPRQPLNAVPYAIGLLPGATVDQPAANSRALAGRATGANGIGVLGESASWAGVWGQSASASGVVGRSGGQFAGGVFGENTGQGYGVYGKAPNSAGVFGESTAWFGVYGKSANQTGVVGESTSHDGVRGTTSAANRVGVKGVAHAANATGVRGESTSWAGVWGESASASGVVGISSGQYAAGLYGENKGQGYGVWGKSPNGAGVVGESTAWIGVYGLGSDQSTEGKGVWGEGYTGVYGIGKFGKGVWGEGSTGVYGRSGSGTGVWGVSTSGYGIWAESTTGQAGFFRGDVNVNGRLTKSAGSFKIDHPLDPANKYLYHSFVESPDMKNIYDGIVTTDANGEATVTLSDWFEALNKDFRYQLTPVGQFAQAIISKEITNNQFTIKTDKPNVRVSWQVTGIRHDPYANTHRIPTEEDKPTSERGAYLYPALYGLPEERGIAHILHLDTTQNVVAISRQGVNNEIALRR